MVMENVPKTVPGPVILINACHIGTSFGISPRGDLSLTGTCGHNLCDGVLGSGANPIDYLPDFLYNQR